MRQRMQDDFQDTRPIREHQERLHAQLGRPRAHYVPNRVPRVTRALYAIVSLIWLGWALIGLLSGHMYFLISRGGPIHFSGIPALLFSMAVLAGAAACSVAIVDHHDRRDNEKSYRRARRVLWWSALAGLGLALLVAAAETFSLLPYTTGNMGMLSVSDLKALLKSDWLSRVLAPHREAFSYWHFVTLFGALFGIALLKKLGFLNEHQPRLVPALITTLLMLAPALLLALGLVQSLVSGSAAASAANDEVARAQLAWIQSMLLMCIGFTSLGLLAVVIFVLRLTGLMRAPPDPRTASDA
jgi:MFS family permease